MPGGAVDDAAVARQPRKGTGEDAVLDVVEPKRVLERTVMHVHLTEITVGEPGWARFARKTEHRLARRQAQIGAQIAGVLPNDRIAPQPIDTHRRLTVTRHLRDGRKLHAIDGQHGQGIHVAIHWRPSAANELRTMDGNDAGTGALVDHFEGGHLQRPDTLLIRIGILWPTERAQPQALRRATFGGRSARRGGRRSPFRRRRIETGHTAAEQGPGTLLLPQHVREAVVLTSHVDQVAPTALDGKRLVRKRCAIGFDRASGPGRQLHQADLAQQAARIRPEDKPAVRADALIGAESRHASVILAHRSHIERQIGDMGDARLVYRTLRQGRCGDRRTRQHHRPQHEANLNQGHGCASRSARRAASTCAQAASGITPQTGQGCTRPQRLNTTVGA